MTAPPRRLDLSPILVGNIGNVLEWYDFVVFAFLAPVISARFFPSADPLSGLIQTFGVFAVGYLMRPIGGMLFGHLGDRLGRKRALQRSMVVMVVPTALIAVLPTHAEAGVLAAVVLVALRLAQGLSIGGELAGSICYPVEAAPPGRRAFFGSPLANGVETEEQGEGVHGLQRFAVRERRIAPSCVARGIACARAVATIKRSAGSP